MKRLSNKAIKRIIAGSLALSLMFGSIGLNNFTWADSEDIEEVQEVSEEEVNANTNETIDEVSESELETDKTEPTDAVEDTDIVDEKSDKTAESDEKTEDGVAVEDNNSKESSETPNTDECTHEDADEDGICDKCGESIVDKDIEDAKDCEHVDENKDGICDKCGKEMPKEDTEELEAEKVFELNATEIQLGIDDTFEVTATLDGEDVTENIKLSTDDKVVSIENYTIFAIKEGETVVTAEYVDDENTYTSSMNVVVVNDIIIDEYNAAITRFNENAPIFVKSEDLVESSLPKAVKASIIIFGYELDKYNYTADELLSNGFTHDESFDVYTKDNANIEINWETKGKNAANGYEYIGKPVSGEYKINKLLAKPEIAVYVYDGEYAGSIDPNTFVPMATDGNPVASIDGELELSYAYPSRIDAWMAKYAPEKLDLLLKYDDSFFENLAPKTKEIVESYRIIERYSDEFGNYISNLPISEFLELKNKELVDLSSSSLAGTDITDEQLIKLGEYGFTILDVALFIDAYNGMDNSSNLYRLYMSGQHSDSVDYLYSVIDSIYHTNDKIYINGKATKLKNVDAVEDQRAVEEAIKMHPTTETDETIKEDIVDSDNIAINLFNKFAFINAFAAEEKEPPVREGDGWYDHLATGTGDTLVTKDLTRYTTVHKGRTVNIVGHNSYEKTDDSGNYMFCANPWKTLRSTKYMHRKFYQNGWACVWADNRFTYEDRQALMWYKMALDENQGRLQELKATIENTYKTSPAFYYPMFGGLEWLQSTYGDVINKPETGYAVYIATNGGANQQVLFVPQVGIPVEDSEIMISTETRYATGSATTTYTTDIDKYSVITNEKLENVRFNLYERVANNPQGSSDLREETRTDLPTDANGYRSETFTHSASWSIPYEEIKDEAAILEYIGTGEASPAFVDYYETLRATIDSGTDGIQNQATAQAEVNRLRNAFLAVEYDYTWEETAPVERKSSSSDQNGKSLNAIKLPKFGYRMNVVKVDNNNKYSQVTTSDLTSPSTKTTSAVANGGNGHVDISNQPWRAQIFINKTDLETNNQIVYDTKFDIYENNKGKWIQDNYRVVRINEEIVNTMGWDKSTIGMYTIEYIGTGFGGKNPADNYEHTPLKYGTVYFTQANDGKFKIVETKAPSYEDGKTGYIGNFNTRPYTRVENDMEKRFALTGRTDKTYPTPQQIVNDLATKKIEHEIQLCKDSDQYENFMLTDTGISRTPIYQGNYYFNNSGYDNSTHYYVGSTEGTTEGVDKLYYTGTYTDTKLNYNSFVPGDKASEETDKNTYDLATTLNNRHGYNGTEFVSVEKPEVGREYAFINERTKGFIRLTKFDIDAQRYVDGDLRANYRDGTDHGDADLDGAIYSLYVDDSSESYNSVQMNNGGITHPDGNKSNTIGATESAKYYNNDGIAILREQQQFVDTDNDGFADTWTVADVTLTPGTKVASATIKNGELEFDGLYPGNYYIVEEVRSVEHIYGIDENDKEVEDENWLSFAPGYLADTYKTSPNTYALTKHHYQIQYNGETDYVVKDTDKVTNDTAIKGKVRIVKVTSDETVGSTTNNLDKESGAGFTVYLISELTKIKDGTIQPMWSLQRGHQMVEDGTLVKLYDDQEQFVGYKLADPQGYGLEGELRHTNRFVLVPGYGYYQMDQILAAYMNEVYSDKVAKWGQFDNETQAIARVYEKDASVIAKANADYQFLPGNHAGTAGAESEWWGPSGIGKGYENASLLANKYAYATHGANSRTNLQTSNEYVLSELFTNTRGQIKIPQLAWGSYLIVNTTVPVDKGVADPVFVTISDTTDDNSITTAEPPYNLPIKPYNGTKYRVRIVKRDLQSGQNVLLANTKFRIWDYQAQKYLRLTVQGSAGIAASSCIFETDDSGFINYEALSMLEIGKYRIEEVEGPVGFWNAYWDYGNASDKNNLFTDKLGYTHYVVDKKQGHELTIDPNGNVTTSDASKANVDNMRQENFGAVDFQVTTDRRWVSAAIVSDILTTDNNEDILYLGESYFNSETLGMLTIMKTGEVLVGYDKTDDIEYRDEYKTVTEKDDNQDKTFKTRKAFVDNVEKFDIGTDRDSTQKGKGAEYESDYYDDDLVEASYDYDDDTYDFVYEERPLANAVFQIVAAENIYSQDHQINSNGQRATWFKQGDVVATVVTARNGEVMDVVPNYTLKDGEVETFTSTSTINNNTFTQTYTNKDYQTTGGIDNQWIESRMSDLDKAIFGVPEFDDPTIYPNSYYNEDGEQQVVVRVLKDGTLGQVSILLPLGKYTVKEIEAPYGYVLPEYSEFDSSKTNKSIDVEFTWKDQIKEVVFNTNDASVADTKSKIDSFMDRNLAWWHGGVNDYRALALQDSIGVTNDQEGKDISSNNNADKRSTFTDGFIHENAPSIIGDAEVQYYKDEEGFINFYDERVKPYADKDKSKQYLSVGIYKVDWEDTDKTLAGAKFGLYTKDDIYNVDGELLVPADTRLAVATTNEDGFAEFEVDIPYKSLHYGNTTGNDKELYNGDKTINLSIDGNTSFNSGAYYIKELTPPVGYLFNDSVVTNTLDESVDLTFDPMTLDDTQHDKQLLYPVYAEQKNLQTEVDISKRDIVNEKEIAGANLEVYEVFGPNGGRVVYTDEGAVDWSKCKLGKAIDSWTSEEDKTHVIRGLELSNREVPRLDNDEIREHVYLLRETSPADGYVTAKDIVFEVVQNYTVNADGTITWDTVNNTVWVLNETTIDYIDGVVKAQPYYTDHEGNDIYNYNHDHYLNVNDAANDASKLHKDNEKNDIVDGVQPGNSIANWIVLDGTLVIDIENDATVEAISHAFTAERIIEALNVDSPDAAPYVISNKAIHASDVKRIYFVSNKAVSGDVLDAAKANLFAEVEGNIFTEDMLVDEMPETTAEWLDAKKLSQKNPELVVVPRFDWTSCNDAYNSFQNAMTDEYGAKQFDRKPARSIERTIVMEDERTKLYISKADIANDNEVVGAYLEIVNEKGEVVDSWISNGEDHYVERLPIGKYTLNETQAPNEDGYVTTASIKFEIEDNGHINTVYMPDNYTRLKIKKTDITTGKNVIGATLAIYNENKHDIVYNGETIASGEVVTTWETTKEDTYIDRLPTGVYRLVEELAPTENGYTTANDIIFTIKDEDVVNVIDMKDDYTVTEINKTDLVTGEEIAGAKLELYRLVDITELVHHDEYIDENGKLVPATDVEEVVGQEKKLLVSWITGDKDSIKVEDDVDFIKGEITSTGKILLTYLPVGKFAIVERTPADGYTTANDVTFEVVDKLYHYEDDNATILRDKDNIVANDKQIIKAEMKDDFTVVKFNKVDAVNNENIEGAKLEVYAVEVDKDGNVKLVDKVDEDGNVVKDDNGNVIRQAVRIDADEKAEGVNPMYSWTSGEDGKDDKDNVLAHVIERMPIGKYVLVETSAPDGYLVANEVVFEVTDKFYHYKDAQGKELNEVDGKIVANEEAVIDVTMKDERALLISKQNIVTGQEIAGAELRIYEYVEPELVEKEVEAPVTEADTEVTEPDTDEVLPADETEPTPTVEYVEVPHDYSNDEVIEGWTSTKKPHGVKLENLVVGKEYVLHEESAPEGYFIASDIRFRLVEKPGVMVPEVQVWDIEANEFVSVETRMIVMKDDVTRVFVHKVDSNGNYVVGAQLGIYPVVKNLLGVEKVDWNNPKVVYNTNGNYADIQALPLGKYVLHEISAPSGYHLAADIEFEITENTKSENALVITMVDANIKSDNNTPSSTPVKPVEQPEAPQPEVIVVEPVKTGDNNYVLPFILGGIFLAIAAGASLVLYKRKDEDDEESDDKNE